MLQVETLLRIKDIIPMMTTKKNKANFIFFFDFYLLVAAKHVKRPVI